jgi:hypothetical protein
VTGPGEKQPTEATPPVKISVFQKGAGLVRVINPESLGHTHNGATKWSTFQRGRFQVIVAKLAYFWKSVETPPGVA